MKEKTFDGLTIRKLKTKDAANFAKISNGLGMAQYLSYFRAKNVSEAENIIVKNNRNGYAMYGLFVRRIGLVSVFYVSPPDSSGGAEISYFTGEDYFGNDYASRGVQLLAKTFLILLLLLKRKMMPVLLCKVNSVLRNFHLLPERIGIFFTILTGCNMAKKMGTVTNSVPTFFFFISLYFIFFLCDVYVFYPNIPRFFIGGCSFIVCANFVINSLCSGVNFLGI